MRPAQGKALPACSTHAIRSVLMLCAGNKQHARLVLTGGMCRCAAVALQGTVIAEPHGVSTGANAQPAAASAPENSAAHAFVSVVLSSYDSGQPIVACS